MAVTPKVLTRSVLTAASATLYTVPASTTTVITSIVLANSTAAAVTVTLNLDGVPIASGLSVAANATTVMDMRQVLITTKTITGLASSAAAIGCHISGTEIV